MTTAEMKEVLASKLKEEGTYFTKSHISIKKAGNGIYKIVIKDYEHIPFIMSEEYDDYFGYILYIEANDHNIAFIDSKKSFDYQTAMIRLGYYIATRF